MGVSTGTVCPFPFTTTNISATPTDVAQCTVTYATAIGPVYEVFRGLLLGISSLGIIVMSRRLGKFREYTAKIGVNMYVHPMFRMTLAALFFDVVYLISSVDMFAFSGIYPAPFFAVCDEIVAASGLSNAVLAVDLYHQLAKSLHDKYRMFSIIARNVTLVAIWVNFLGFITLQIVDSDRFHLYEGLKCILGASILLVFVFLSTYYVKQLLVILEQGRAINASKSRADKQIGQLKRKHSRFLFVVAFASIALFATGVLALTAEDYSWTLRIETMPDIAQLVLRLVFVAYICLQFYIVRVPKLQSESSATSSSDGKIGPQVPSPSTVIATLPAFSSASNPNQVAPASSLVVSSMQGDDVGSVA